jgi:type VI secretion system protein ImpC
MTHQPRPTLSFSFETRGAKLPPRTQQSPFVIALFGDFSGRSNRGLVHAVSEQAPVEIDIDNFDETMSRLCPTLVLPDADSPGASLELSFSELDDFHPDQFATRLPGIQQLRALRPRLSNPLTSAAAASELQVLLHHRAESIAVANVNSETDTDTLTRLLGRSLPQSSEQPAPAASPVSSAQDAVRRLAQQAVAGNVVAKPTPSQTDWLAKLDRACADKLDAVLHDPHFQALESAWRSVDRLVRTFDESDQVKLKLVDISLEELSADLNANEDVTSSGLYRLLYDATSTQAWAAIGTFYTFGESAEDIAIAGKFALAGGYLSTPVIAAADSSLIGSPGFASAADPDKWSRPNGSERAVVFEELRSKPEAAYLALALPRFLVRQPYGKGSDAIQLFAYEEIASAENHEDYLWGNPSVLIAELLIARFKQDGWALSPDTGGDVSDIPVHHYKSGGESLIKPCAEAWLTDRAAAAIQQRGVIPVLSIKNRDAVRVVGISSVASPAQPLALRLG